MTITPDAAAKTISEFRSAVAARKIQQPNRYKVLIQDNASNQLTCYPESVTLPQRSFNTAPYTPWGPILQLPVRREYGECAMSFIIYEDWQERKFLESWMDRIIPVPSSQSSSQIVGSGNTITSNTYSDYSNAFNNSTGTVVITTNPIKIGGNKSVERPADKGDETSNIILNEAFPLTITPTQLSSEATGYTTFVAIFAFKDYEFVKP